jgi:hypothetical protein
MTPARYKTLRHMETVRNYLNAVITELLHRGERHDQTKLESPEVEAYDVITEGLRGLTYGSEEYRDILKAHKPAIDHHYHFNRHHPEFFMDDSYRGMTLIDLLEMICDWKASTLRHGDGDIYKSIEINQQRFGYSYELARILRNTVDWLNEQEVFHKAEES